MTYSYQFYNSSGVPFFRDNDRVFMFMGYISIRVPPNTNNSLTANHKAITHINWNDVNYNPTFDLPVTIRSRNVLIFARQFSDMSVCIHAFTSSSGEIMYEPVFCGNTSKYAGSTIVFAVYGQLEPSEILHQTGYGISVYNPKGSPIYSTNHKALQIIDSVFLTNSLHIKTRGYGVLQNFSRTNNLSRWWHVPLAEVIVDWDFKAQVFAYSYFLIQSSIVSLRYVYIDSESSQNIIRFEPRTFFLASIDAPF